MLAIRTALPCGKLIATVMANTGRHVRWQSNRQFSAWPRAIFQQQIKDKQQQQQQYRMLATKPPAKDSEDVQLQRVYYGSLAPRMKLVKLFSLTTSLAGIAAQPILMEQGMKIGGTGMAVALCTVGGFFTFVTPLLLHFITKKYVTELHYNPVTEEYTATTISLILMKIKVSSESLFENVIDTIEFFRPHLSPAMLPYQTCLACLPRFW